eukprot:CAMPEP_0194757672 /NCGR_PEP_ID=MMETSP0323_2-20130528/11122_1 /TAXON_ID=2866 ORGANISM="Crypthecodinium cohnii, Strain Seligo" /NCGR_SAMPLE_ID=MMETSP0323_2 /ASSEMBLY_ACC=CAM_ASM_000346 /LENGTH=34 /DNA_ID= /DNA_START= /DNA_END= /DNA_ORIENTATION=
MKNSRLGVSVVDNSTDEEDEAEEAPPENRVIILG